MFVAGAPLSHTKLRRSEMSETFRSYGATLKEDATSYKHSAPDGASPNSFLASEV